MTNKQVLFNKYIGKIMHHGMTSHPGNERYDCMKCIEVELWFLNKIKKAGGQTKLLEKMKKEMDEKRQPKANT